jgi:hypothetical protein
MTAWVYLRARFVECLTVSSSSAPPAAIPPSPPASRCPSTHTTAMPASNLVNKRQRKIHLQGPPRYERARQWIACSGKGPTLSPATSHRSQTVRRPRTSPLHAEPIHSHLRVPMHAAALSATTGSFPTSGPCTISTARTFASTESS